MHRVVVNVGQQLVQFVLLIHRNTLETLLKKRPVSPLLFVVRQSITAEKSLELVFQKLRVWYFPLDESLAFASVLFVKVYFLFPDYWFHFGKKMKMVGHQAVCVYLQIR